MPTELHEGDAAPDFTLPASSGQTISLHDYRGKYVVLYFYPADDTPGCTREACSFRDYHHEILQAGAVVLGVSPYDVTSHDRFAQKYTLPFPLLADVDHRVAEAYGAWGEKTRYGRTTVGLIRSTFLIDPEGKIARAWRGVRVDGHTDQVLAALPARA